MPLVKEGSPNGEMKNGFKRIIKAFLQAYQEGIAENVREQEEFTREVFEEADRLKQATAQQTEATT